MSGREEDPYSQIFSILKHPTRRLILRSLAKGSGERFSQLQSELKVDSPSLSYHLDALGRLVEKKDEFYFPTELGKAALSMMKNVEEPPEHKMIPVPQDTARTILTWLMLLLLLGFGTFGLLTLSASDNPSHRWYSEVTPYNLRSGEWTSFAVQVQFNTPKIDRLQNGFIIYSPYKPSSTPWETTVLYASFSSELVNGTVSYWLSRPNGSLVPQGETHSVALETDGVLGATTFYAPIVDQGPYTFHVQNNGFTPAVGDVTFGPSTVVYSRPGLFAGLLLLAPPLGYLGISGYHALKRRRHRFVPAGVGTSQLASTG